MSDTSDDIKTDRSNDSSQDSICRDFIRGTCDRKFCKYKHENEVRTLNFCHDFQNSTCPRPNCKFIHCSTEEVEEYKKCGEMSNQIFAEASRKSQLPGIQPICNMFRKGICRRSVCKYRHITKDEEESEIMELLRNNSNHRNKLNNNHNINESPIPHIAHFDSVTDLPRYTFNFDDCEYGASLAKRRCFSRPDLIENCLSHELHRKRSGFRGYFAGNPPQMFGRFDTRAIMLEEENSLLHKEIAQLKKQVSDLTATNEFLLDQNATLRITGKRNGSVTVPAVTITNSLPQNPPPQPQQVIRTVTASVATVPVSLATVTTCNAVSVAGCPSVSIATPAQILAPSQQILVTTNQSNQLTLASNSQAQLAIAQQNLANNLAQQAQPQLTSQAQLALATTTQQLTSQAQHIANQQLALASAPQQLTSQTQLAMGTLANNNQQITLTSAQSHLTSQAQQLANQQLTSQAQQLALANTLGNNTTQQLTSQAQQMALANTPQQLAVASVPQQLALASTSQQLLAQQNLASSQQLEMHRNNQMNAINTSQTIAMSNTTQPMVSYPIMTQSINHALSH